VPTTPRILEMFEGLRWHEYRENGRVVSFPVTLNKTQELILDLLEVPRTTYV
jgi:hypothetical protein